MNEGNLEIRDEPAFTGESIACSALFLPLLPPHSPSLAVNLYVKASSISSLFTQLSPSPQSGLWDQGEETG